MPQRDHTEHRTTIAFRAVNACGSAGYDPALQRHHLLPRQLLSERCFGRMFAALGRAEVGFDDFRRNGLLLPAREDASLRTGMPLHRGPHHRYTEMVIARVGTIEARWAEARKHDEAAALEEALLRLHLLQGALRRQLLAARRRIVLSRKDPLGSGFDFNELDAMAELLWGAD
ncbi:AHH domain-containing protein [Erythrobacter sp. NE805]|uniref:AHH domain-containing protein n=1 Tax=Erythrobacter sp. NE805 TaxID=3389875 RepID=UPI00396B0719